MNLNKKFLWIFFRTILKFWFVFEFGSFIEYLLAILQSELTSSHCDVRD